MEMMARTIYGSYLQTCLLERQPFVVMPNSTLNQKFDVQNGVLPSNGELPSMKYWGIGIGGHGMTIGSDGIPLPTVIQHRATDAALYHHMPFVLRELDNDLAPVQRARFAMRKVVTIGSKQYAAYYLRRIDYTGAAPIAEYVTVVDNVETPSPFVPDSTNLNPTPPILNSDGTNVVSGDFTSVTSKIVLGFTADDAAEYLNVARLLFNNEAYSIISEICMVSGVDKMVDSPSVGSTTITFNEALVAQVVAHIAANFQIKAQNDGFTEGLDVGSTEPLFSLV